MKWNTLTDTQQIETIQQESRQQPIIIFKHSTRCSISRAALDRLERSWKQEEVPSAKAYFLDLLSYRDISNQIAELFEVEHESPQVLIIRDGKAIFDRSHLAIDFTGIKGAIHAGAPSKN